MTRSRVAFVSAHWPRARRTQPAVYALSSAAVDATTASAIGRLYVTEQYLVCAVVGSADPTALTGSADMSAFANAAIIVRNAPGGAFDCLLAKPCGSVRL